MQSERERHLETLSEIRTMMERSSRFISLSGLSGISVGIFAILGGILIYSYTGKMPFDGMPVTRLTAKWDIAPRIFFPAIVGFVLLGAIFSALVFTRQKARRQNLPSWDALSKRLLLNLLIPLMAGGIFCLGLIYNGSWGFLSASMLVFYGLALINASKYTLNDIRGLGMLEIGLGCLSLFAIGYSLEFWLAGFGLLHIIYGIYMYLKYEKSEETSA